VGVRCRSEDEESEGGKFLCLASVVISVIF
jgi:hypothetical protein